MALGCLTLLLGLVALGVVNHYYFRTPTFSGSSPMAIEIVADTPDLSKDLYYTNINDRAACSNILRALGEARVTGFHACPTLGWFAVLYDNGKSEMIHFLPGHDPNRYEIRCASGNFALSRQRFYQVLKDAGVDTTKIPEGKP